MPEGKDNNPRASKIKKNLGLLKERREGEKGVRGKEKARLTVRAKKKEAQIAAT